MEKLIKQLKANTERNNHTNNYILICEHFQLNRLEEIFTAINKIQDAEGHLPHEISQYRHNKYTEMMGAVAGKTNLEEYKSIYSCI